MVKKRASLADRDPLDALFAPGVGTPPARPVAPLPTAQKPKKETLVKLSLYLIPDEVDALDQLVMKRRRETGRSPRRNALIREAIQQYIKNNSLT
jgi:hypothetical protein